MKIGMCCAGIGAASTGDFIRRSAQAAERAGFSTYWLPEHVLLFGAYPESIYPYVGMFGDDVPIPDPRIPFADPVIGITWAAAATSSIEIGSGIVILPQRNPVVLAKEIVTLDEFSGGRVVLGVGVGWCKEEYDAVGADWSTRGRRTDEHIAVMRALWKDGVSEFDGDTFAFDDAYMYPKPVGDGVIPILIGGESDFALKRVALSGDGWIAFKLPVEDAAARIAKLKLLTHEQGRDPESLRIIVSIFSTTTFDDLKRYRDAGATEFNVINGGQLPVEDAALNQAVAELGQRLIEPLASW